jgi:hypothetical protein
LLDLDRDFNESLELEVFLLMKLSLRFFIPLVGITALSVSTLASDMISHSGHLRTRFELQKNVGGVTTDWTEKWLNRVRLNVDISPSKTVMVRFTPQATHTFGTMLGGAANPAAVNAQEAWMSWTASDMLSLFVGRQMVSLGRGLLIGHDDWGQANNYFDMARAQFTYDLGVSHFFFAKVNETPMVGTTETSDQDLWGLYNSLNPDMGALKNLDIYAFWRDNRTTGATRSRVATFGARAEGNLKMVDYNLELTGQFGKANSLDVKGFQADAEAGVKVMDVHHVALALAYANTEFTDLFPDTHNQFGKADIITARNNILQIAVLTAWKLHDKWKANIDGYYFMAPKDTAGIKSGNLALVGGKRAVGMEGDIGLTYMPEKSLAFEAGYDLFKGGDAIKPNDQTYSGFYLQGTATF